MNECDFRLLDSLRNCIWIHSIPYNETIKNPPHGHSIKPGRENSHITLPPAHADFRTGAWTVAPWGGD